MYYSDFKNAINPESIRRARQLVQADHPELQANEVVRNFRITKSKQKGTFAYRETVEKGQFNPLTQTYEYK